MGEIEIRIIDTPLDPGALLASVSGRDTGCGAVASFVGQVRDEDNLAALELEHYPGATESALTEIAQNAVAHWKLGRVLLHHRVGRMAPGEPIVVIAVAAAHRREAFDAVSYLIDVLKTQAPFWKRLHTRDGNARWLEVRPDDAEAGSAWLTELQNKDA